MNLLLTVRLKISSNHLFASRVWYSDRASYWMYACVLIIQDMYMSATPKSHLREVVNRPHVDAVNCSQVDEVCHCSASTRQR